MITHTITRPVVRWTGSDGHVFELKSTYLQDNSTWVTYTSTRTHKEYTCLQEAFEARFTPLVD